MAKIIISVGGRQLQELVLSKERTIIGRRTHNDIVLDTPAISAVHAVIVAVDDDAFLEDLNSTNGTRVNGQPIKKHFLQNNDVIELSKYQIRYVANANRQTDEVAAPGEADPFATVSGFYVQTRDDFDESLRAVPGVPYPPATIRVMNGASIGKAVVINKALTTIGRPGLQVAVITRSPHGYCITHVEGENYPSVNGQSIGTNMRLLEYDDVIDVAGTQMEFTQN